MRIFVVMPSRVGNSPSVVFYIPMLPDKLRQKYHIHDDDPNMPYGRKTVCWANNLTGEFPVDDDINYTVLALQVMETYGKNFTAADVAEAWLYGLPAMHACTAERVAYRNLLHRRMPPVSAKFLNPFREWIGAQIRVDPLTAILPPATRCLLLNWPTAMLL